MPQQSALHDSFVGKSIGDLAPWLDALVIGKFNKCYWESASIASIDRITERAMRIDMS